MKDYYKILQVDRDADIEIIKKLYKYHVSKSHPDLYTGEKKQEAEKN